MKSHLQFCGQYGRTNHKYSKIEEIDIGMVWRGMSQFHQGEGLWE